MTVALHIVKHKEAGNAEFHCDYYETEELEWEAQCIKMLAVNILKSRSLMVVVISLSLETSHTQREPTEISWARFGNISYFLPPSNIQPSHHIRNFRLKRSRKTGIARLHRPSWLFKKASFGHAMHRQYPHHVWRSHQVERAPGT
jgi:hypothetical protein